MVSPELVNKSYVWCPRNSGVPGTLGDGLVDRSIEALRGHEALEALRGHRGSAGSSRLCGVTRLCGVRGSAGSGPVSGLRCLLTSLDAERQDDLYPTLK